VAIRFASPLPQKRAIINLPNPIERLLLNLNGIKSAKANPLTGNLLVLFDSKSIKHEDVVEALKKQGYLEELKVQRRSVRVPAANRVLPRNHATNIVTDIVLQKAVEMTIRQALLALL
jgi:copper chaperone CopZ